MHRQWDRPLTGTAEVCRRRCGIAKQRLNCLTHRLREGSQVVSSLETIHKVKSLTAQWSSNTRAEICRTAWPDLQHSAQLPSGQVHQEVSKVSKDVGGRAHFTLRRKGKKNISAWTNTTCFSQNGAFRADVLVLNPLCIVHFIRMIFLQYLWVTDGWIKAGTHQDQVRAKLQIIKEE